MRSLTMLSTLLCIGTAIIVFWLGFKEKKQQPLTRTRRIFEVVIFTLSLLVGCSILNSIGWVVYYSPASAVEAVQEFKNGMTGLRCG